MARSANENRQVVTDEQADGILYGYFEARYQQHLSEVEGWWDTPRGHAAEAAMSYLRMALEAMGYTDIDEPANYQAFLASR